MTAVSSNRLEISRWEWVAIGLAMLVGVILRMGVAGRIAVEHFDEGVYASNFWFGAEAGYEYPARHLYGPPLLPLVIEWVMIGASLLDQSLTGIVPILPGIVAGLLTIPAMWIIGRSWFSPRAGLVAAWLVAVSDFHVSYSRSGMTDVPVCLLMLWSVYFASKALRSGSIRDTSLAGFLTGLAWSTKYSGWLPLAIALSGGVAWQFTTARAQRQVESLVVRWFIMSGIAMAVWSPVLYGLQKHGGYAAVAANHRQYVVGTSGWIRSAERQLANVGLYESWLNLPAELSSAMSQDPSAGMLPLGSRALLVVPILVLLVGCLGCARWTLLNWGTSKSLPAWMLLAWIGGLSLSVPFYHPYPRLVLPLLFPLWMGIGLAFDQILGTRRFGSLFRIETRSVPWKSSWLEIVLFGLLAAASLTRTSLGAAWAWQDRADLSRACIRLAKVFKAAARDAGHSADEAIVYVYGEPAIVYGLKANGLPLVGPIQDFGFLSKPALRPTFLVYSTRAELLPAFRSAWEQQSNNFEIVEHSTVHLSHLVVLDEDLPLDQLDELHHKGQSLYVWRVR